MPIPLFRRQVLDRIVVDESQLTITVNEYRPCMSQLGWYIRQVRTQTVWLTATLPPVMQEGSLGTTSSLGLGFFLHQSS
jgi:hypothetical protein